MHVSKLLPAGVPRGLIRARHRIAHILSEAPVLFLAIVLGVALTFRFGIGALRATDPSETASSSSTGKSAIPHEQPRITAVGAGPTTTTATLDPTPDAVLPSAPGASPIVRPSTTAPAQHRKPRTHGRR